MIITKKITLKKLGKSRPFICNGEHCNKKLGEIELATGYLYQQSRRWHFSNVIIEAIITCQCGWQTHYKAENFKE